MKHKAKECVWAPGMQDTDVTYAGVHTWAEIDRVRKERDRENGPGSPKGLFIVLGLGAAGLLIAAWLM